MYPDDIDNITTSKDLIESIITPVIAQELEEEDSCLNLVGPQSRNLSQDLESVDDGGEKADFPHRARNAGGLENVSLGGPYVAEGGCKCR